MESAEYHNALAALAWQIELGADESISDAPVDRYDVPAAAAKPAAAVVAAVPVGAPPPMQEVDFVAIARAAADGAHDLEGLRAALAGFDHCDLKLGARNLVFSDGVAGARVMIVTEAPTRDEDREGRPFVGRSAQLLDKMLAAIDLSREPSSGREAGAQKHAVYIASVMPWRTPQDRDPKPEEIAMMLPFLHRHIALAQPDVLVLMGNQTCQALLGKRGITRLRGEWTEALGKPALPMFHPEQLMRAPLAKRDAWADLLSLKARLTDG